MSWYWVKHIRVDVQFSYCSYDLHQNTCMCTSVSLLQRTSHSSHWCSLFLNPVLRDRSLSSRQNLLYSSIPDASQLGLRILFNFWAYSYQVPEGFLDGRVHLHSRIFSWRRQIWCNPHHIHKGGEHLSFNALSASLGCSCVVASPHNDVGALPCAVEVSDLL